MDGVFCHPAATIDNPLLRQYEKSMHLTSSSIANGQPIPAIYTCDGQNISPPLAWDGAPEGTQSFALIMSDPDAPDGTFLHWIVYNIPAGLREIAEGIVPEQAREAENSFGKTSYGGPCPPSGTHRYSFWLHALDLPLLKSTDTKTLMHEMNKHSTAEAELMGTYSRPEKTS